MKHALEIVQAVASATGSVVTVGFVYPPAGFVLAVVLVALGLSLALFAPKHEEPRP